MGWTRTILPSLNGSIFLHDIEEGDPKIRIVGQVGSWSADETRENAIFLVAVLNGTVCSPPSPFACRPWMIGPLASSQGVTEIWAGARMIARAAGRDLAEKIVVSANAAQRFVLLDIAAEQLQAIAAGSFSQEQARAICHDLAQRLSASRTSMLG